MTSLKVSPGFLTELTEFLANDQIRNSRIRVKFFFIFEKVWDVESPRIVGRNSLAHPEFTGYIPPTDKSILRSLYHG